jgi:hypothetical protein
MAVTHRRVLVVVFISLIGLSPIWAIDGKALALGLDLIGTTFGGVEAGLSWNPPPTDTQFRVTHLVAGSILFASDAIGVASATVNNRSIVRGLRIVQIIGQVAVIGTHLSLVAWRAPASMIDGTERVASLVISAAVAGNLLATVTQLRQLQ